jgi:hypothetical protein
MMQVDQNLFKEFKTGATLAVAELRRVNAARVQRTMHLIFTCERHILGHLSAAVFPQAELRPSVGGGNEVQMDEAVTEAMDTLRFLHSLLEGDPSADVGAALAGQHPKP